jgi:glycine/D-amino acid oxidase-like deaminating enzyme
MSLTFDVIVVGAGYVGTSVAYHLSSAGVKTALLDKGALAAGASRANYGNIQIQDMELSKSTELIRQGRKRLSSIEDELGRSVGRKRIGGLLLIENEAQWKTMQARLDALHSEGIPSELIPASRLREIEPSLDNTQLIGGLYHPEEGQLNPFQLIWAFLLLARDKGLEEFYFREVIGFDFRGGRITGVRTNQGPLSAPIVVLCTGAGTSGLGRMLGRDWDVPYILGQAMVTEPIGPTLHCHISSASFFEQEDLDQAGGVRIGLAMSQSPHGHLLLGEAMIEGSEADHRVPAASLPAIAASVRQYFPSFSRLRVLRGWSTAVAFTRDSCPWLGPVPGLEGLLVATAFRSTVIITPLVGELVTQIVTRGKCDLAIGDFMPERRAAHAR